MRITVELLTVDLLRAHREGIHDAAAERFEYRIESRGGDAILELELHLEVHAAAALADGIEAPCAGEIAKRPVREPHVDLRVWRQRVARGEFRSQDPMRYFQHGDALGCRDILDANPDAPGQKLRIARHIIHQG